MESLIPGIEKALDNDKTVDHRRGSIEALSVVITASPSSEVFENYNKEIVRIFRVSLCDPDLRLRQSAGETFAVYHNVSFIKLAKYMHGIECLFFRELESAQSRRLSILSSPTMRKTSQKQHWMELSLFFPSIVEGVFSLFRLLSKEFWHSKAGLTF